MGDGVDNVVRGIVLGNVVQARDIGQVVLPGAAPNALTGLPPDPPEFTGRDAELATLLNAPITVLSGLPGVGKTTLAVRAAHRFGGDALFIDLRGYDPDHRMAPTTALAVALRALGVAGEHIPPDQAALEALYRTRLADREPMVIVLDNADSTDQVVPLLVDRHKVLVTSRHRLADLPGARQVELAVLTTEEAVAFVTTALARRCAGKPRVGTPELAELCGHLPLALSIAAAILTDEQDMTVDELVTVLRKSSPLEELQYGTTSGVRGAFDLSYARLTDEERRVFLSFAVHVVSWHTVESAAATNALPVPVTRRVLRSLRRAHLVEPGHRDGWFTLHDLLSTYVRARSQVETTAEATFEMRQRFCDYLAAGLDDAGAWHEKDPPAESRFADAAEAAEWVRRESGNILCAAYLVNRSGSASYAVGLANCSARYVFGQSDWTLGTVLFELGRRFAEQEGDLRQEATMHVYLGRMAQSRYDLEFGASQARLHYQLALHLFRDSAEQDMLDLTTSFLRDLPPLRTLAPEELAQREKAASDENAVVRAAALIDLGNHFHGHAEYEQAVEYFRAALAVLHRPSVGFVTYAMLLSRTATGEFRLARWEDARTHWNEAISVLEATGWPADDLRQNLTAIPTDQTTGQ